MNFDNEWMKFAAAATQSDADVEKAFLDQAWMHLQNKATPLMKPQYRVGFEIVHKNDENTRMIGVFVFRSGKDYFYAPTFFINGSIKGTDLLYRARPKRFVPLTNPWCEFLLSQQVAQEGEGVPQAMRRETRNQMDLTRLVEPPYMQGRSYMKFASVCDTQDDLSLLRADIAEMLEKIASLDAFNEPADSVLRKFILADGGNDAIVKLANAAKRDREFARALMLCSTPDNYMPEIPVVKQASFEPNLVVVHTSVLRNGNVKQASAAQMCEGFLIDDRRKDAAVNETVFTDNAKDLATINEPGVYDILMQGGATMPCLVGIEDTQIKLNGGCSSGGLCYDSIYYEGSPFGDKQQPMVLIQISSRASDSVNQGVNRQVYGQYQDELDTFSDFIEPSSASVDEGYRIFNVKRRSFTQPLYIVGKEKDASGLDVLLYQTYGTGGMNESKRMIVNTRFDDYDANDNIIGKDFKLVRVDVTKDSGGYLKWNRELDLGDKHVLNAFVFENGFKAASVMVNKEGDFRIKSARTNGQWTESLSEPAARVRLMLDCAIREGEAKSLLKQASPDKDLSFFYDGTKTAFNVRFNDFPEFYEQMNDEFGVLEQPQSHAVMQAERDMPDIERHRVGDIWKQEAGDGVPDIDTFGPMQLADLSQQKGLGSLFEHGVVKQLVDTYDSGSMVSTYVTDLEQALDRLGRILFLFYWKPEDFARLYGNDDQTGMENRFVSNFRSLGEMTLELLQKTRARQEGSVSRI
jgi:hypothetical protein